eukprot:Rmarinus@m.16756
MLWKTKYSKALVYLELRTLTGLANKSVAVQWAGGKITDRTPFAPIDNDLTATFKNTELRLFLNVDIDAASHHVTLEKPGTNQVQLSVFVDENTVTPHATESFDVFLHLPSGPVAEDQTRPIIIPMGVASIKAELTTIFVHHSPSGFGAQIGFDLLAIDTLLFTRLADLREDMSKNASRAFREKEKLENSLKTSKENHSALKKEHVSLVASHATLQEAHDALETQLCETRLTLEKTTNDLNDEICCKNSTIAGKDEEITRQSESIGVLQAEVSTLTGTREKLSKETAALSASLEQEKERSAAIVSRLEGEMAEAKEQYLAEVATLRETIQQRESEILALSEKMNTQENQLAKTETLLEETKQSLCVQKEERKKDVEAMEGDLQVFRQSVADLTAQLEVHEARTQAAELELDRQRTRVEELRTELREEQRKSGFAETKAQQDSSSIQDLESRLQDRAGQLAASQAENCALRARVKALESEAQTKIASEATPSSEVNRLSELEDTLSATSAESAARLAKIGFLEKETTKYIATISDLETENRKLQEDLSRTRSEVSSLKSDVEHARHVAYEAQEKADNAVSRAEALSVELEEVKQAVPTNGGLGMPPLMPRLSAVSEFRRRESYLAVHKDPNVLSKQVNSLRSQVLECQVTIGRLQQENIDFASNSEALEKQLKDCEARALDLEARNAGLEAKAKTAEEFLQLRERTIAVLETRLPALGKAWWKDDASDGGEDATEACGVASDNAAEPEREVDCTAGSDGKGDLSESDVPDTVVTPSSLRKRLSIFEQKYSTHVEELEAASVRYRLAEQQLKSAQQEASVLRNDLQRESIRLAEMQTILKIVQDEENQLVNRSPGKNVERTSALSQSELESVATPPEDEGPPRHKENGRGGNDTQLNIEDEPTREAPRRRKVSSSASTTGMLRTVQDIVASIQKPTQQQHLEKFFAENYVAKSSSDPVRLEGMLQRQVTSQLGHVVMWKTRWFAIRGQELFCYHQQDPNQVLLVMPLAAFDAVATTDSSEATFEVRSPKDELVLTLRAATEEDRRKWVTTIKEVSLPDRFFGIALASIMDRPLETGQAVPRLISALLTAIESIGLETEGLYRMSGDRGRVLALMKLCNQGASKMHITLREINDCKDVHVLTGVLKTFLREMPDPLFPEACYDDVIKAQRCSDSDKSAAFHTVVSRLPRAHRDLFRVLLEHLQHVLLHEKSNLMSAKNLGIVLAPNVIRRNDLDQTRAVQDSIDIPKAFEWMLCHREEMVSAAGGVGPSPDDEDTIFEDW